MKAARDEIHALIVRWDNGMLLLPPPSTISYVNMIMLIPPFVTTMDSMTMEDHCTMEDSMMMDDHTTTEDIMTGHCTMEDSIMMEDHTTTGDP